MSEGNEFQSLMPLKKKVVEACPDTCGTTNDLPENLQSQVRLFADDAAVYLIMQGKDDSDRLQRDLDNLQEWKVKWDMEFNPPKWQVIHIAWSESELLLVTRLNDNHSPGPVMREVSP